MQSIVNLLNVRKCSASLLNMLPSTYVHTVGAYVHVLGMGDIDILVIQLLIIIKQYYLDYHDY